MSDAYFIIVLLTLGAIAMLFFLKNFNKKNLKKRIRKLKKTETKVIELLEQQGFEVVDFNKQTYYTVFVNTKPYKICIKADFIVKKENKIYIAQVKSNNQAESSILPATRRQLMEYNMAFNSNGILLADMEKGKICKIEYRVSKNVVSMYISRIIRVIVIFIIGFIVGFLTRGE